MPCYQVFRLEGNQLVYRHQPAAAVGIAHIGHAADEDQIAGKQHTVFLHKHHHIIRRVGRANVAQFEVQPAHFKINIAIQPFVCRNQTTFFIHPRKQRFASLLHE